MADVRDNPNRKTIRIPLAGVNNVRFGEETHKDQEYKGWVFDKVSNPLTGKTTIYCEKTPIPVVSTQLASGYVGVSLINLESHTTNKFVVGFYNDSTNVAQIVIHDNIVSYTETPTGIPYFLTEVKTANYTGTLTTVVLIACDNGTGWFVPMDALTNLTFTGDTHTNTTIDNISSTTGLWVGQEISGTGIQSGTRIASIDSATAITTTLATTATNAGITITRTRIAKIIDSDFPSTSVGPFQVLNGYTYICTSDGYLYNSDLNSITSWTSSGKIAVQTHPDKGVGVFKYKKGLVVFGNNSIEFFEDVGNPLGSPLKLLQDNTLPAGILNARLVCKYGENLYFLGKDKSNIRFFELDNYKLISHTNRFLEQSARLATTAFVAGDLNTHIVIDVLLPAKSVILINLAFSDDESFIFDPELKVFTETLESGGQASLRDITGHCIGTNNPTIPNSYGQSWVVTKSTTTTGYLWSLYNGNYTYGTANYIQTSPLDFGIKNLKRIHKFRLIGDQDTTTNTMTISWSDDDGQTFSTARTVNMGSANPTLINLGNAFRRRIFKIVSSTARAVRLEAIEVEYSELEH